jgi:hypothetical protein
MVLVVDIYSRAIAGWAAAQAARDTAAQLREDH